MEEWLFWLKMSRLFLSRLYGVEVKKDPDGQIQLFLSRLYGVEEWLFWLKMSRLFLSRLYGVEGALF